MANVICLDEKYSTTRMLFKIINNECLDEDGKIKEECKWNIDNLELNIKDSKLIGNPEDKFETTLFLPEGEGRKGEGGLRTKGYFKKSFEDKPLISIITVVFNGEKYLEETIQSVINQTYDNVEYIIIDGGSTDGTLDIIKKYEDQIDYWVSEKDKGIYDAMNKGIDLASGDGLLFLNSGDYFVGEVLSKNVIPPCFLKVKYKNFFNKLVDVKIKSYKKGLPNCHQGIVFENKKIKYDTSYKVASDYDFYLRHGYTSLKLLEFSGYVYYDNSGFSKQNRDIRDKEILNIINKNFNFLKYILFYIKSKIKNIIYLLRSYK